MIGLGSSVFFSSAITSLSFATVVHRLSCGCREIYHCPFCNLCRVGKGLGRDYFHCMTCNACMSMQLTVHKCREKGMESDCPICHDFLFTSNTPVKALPCGHFMHSDCFKVCQMGLLRGVLLGFSNVSN